MPTSPHTISRMKTRPEFLRVARGRRHAVPGLVLQAKRHAPDSDTPSDVRVGFTATKKTGNAVTRNRIKRRLRAAADQVLPAAAQPGYDYVLVGRAATFDRPWQSLLDDLGLALQMVHQPRDKRPNARRAGTSRPKENQSPGRQPKGGNDRKA